MIVVAHHSVIVGSDSEQTFQRVYLVPDLQLLGSLVILLCGEINGTFFEQVTCIWLDNFLTNNLLLANVLMFTGSIRLHSGTNLRDLGSKTRSMGDLAGI